MVIIAFIAGINVGAAKLVEAVVGELLDACDCKVKVGTAVVHLLVLIHHINETAVLRPVLVA